MIARRWFLPATLILSVACAGKMSRVTNALNGYEAALALRADAPSHPMIIGDPIAMRLTLLNRGSQPVTACVGPNQRLLLRATPMTAREGRPPLDERIALVDHPTCERHFSLAPGERLSWSTTVTFKDIGPGTADLDASIQVLHPHDCDQYGCYGTMIAAPPVALQLVRKDP